MPTLDQTITRQRRDAEQADNLVLNRIIQNYGAMTKRLKGRVDALEQFMIRQKEADKYDIATIQKSQQFRDLIDELEEEMGDFSSYLASEIRTDTGRAANDGVIAGLALLAFLHSGQGTPNEPDSEDVALQVLNSYLAKDSPLMEKIRNLAGFNAERVKDLILEGVGVGRNPITIANMIIDDGLGLGLSDALRWTRTAQLYAYRWGTLADYEANSEVVTGWIWWAELDDKTCMSCISLHGKVFSLEDGIPNDHYNGRCAMLPYIPGATDGFADPNAGKDFFDSLPASSQKDMMGPGKYEAFQAGKFKFDALSTFYEDDTFGLMRYETPLKDLVPE